MALRSFGKLARLANLQVTVDPMGKSAYVYIPTLSLDDIDRTGNFNAWRVQKLMTTARIAAYGVSNPVTGKTFLEYNKYTFNLFTFFASAKTEVAREFYDLLDRDEWPGLGIDFHLGYMGSSSMNTVATLSEHISGKELAWNTNALVCVDKATRKVAQIPDEWREKYGSCVVKNEKFVVSQMTVPTETSLYQIRVPWCDTDSYKHTNYLAYVRYCLDAAMNAIATKYYTKFEGDIYNYHMKSLEILFISETLAGDVIDVVTWQDEKDPFLLHFDMKRGDKNIFQCTIGYYES